MPTPSFTVSTDVHAEPGAVFDYVADLTKHSEWAANEVRIEPVDRAPLGNGKQYHSLARARGREFHATLVVTEYNPPSTFAFSGIDETGKFAHRFTFEKIAGRTRVTRRVNFELSLPQYVFYMLALTRVRLPAARNALDKLKEKLEKQKAS